jgi:hypothetical protein
MPIWTGVILSQAGELMPTLCSIWSPTRLSAGQPKYVRYYNESRCHRSLDGNAPVARDVEPPPRGKVVAFPVLGGLHHRYSRAA